MQSFVLRSWEAEFPDLGFAKTANGPRVYRRADVERVLRLKQLLFAEGLTLAGARRRMSEEGLATSTEEVQDADVAAMLDEQAQRSLHDLRRGLQWILGVLNGDGITAEDRVLASRSRPTTRRPLRKASRASTRKRAKRRT